MKNDPQIGVSLRSLNQDANDFLERVEEVNKFDPTSIELMGFNMDLINKGKILNTKTDKIVKILSDYDFKKTIHGPLSVNFLDKADILEDHFNVCISYINLAKILGVTSIVLHTGFCDSTDNHALKIKYLKQSDYLRKIADFAGKNKITILIENIFPFFKNAHTASPTSLRDELAEINHPYLKGCLDVSHAYIFCSYNNEDFLKNVKDFGQYSKHWHVHDSYGKSDISFKPFNQSEALAYGIGDLHLPLGDGDLPWEKIINYIQPDNETIFNIELNPRYWSELGRCFSYLRKLLEKI
tara:strand:- start:5471 stop:6361 length:891 start_codon:yes stop_codon:yes gene_type:complete